ncbi:hypothetical protein CAPTEDRAFT_213957 [Capitella teleta]|uniref:Uncharacterized protein n=1 Tax=Capitella teleta TaxID=283909 RepID=R7UB45_CAPTE|nr:hypothetical protein CAPTEDRAFT_213957 [Capitella teleta]|eukprot:ELU03214.1 hypothetical protein CAPTEDRAFT_213957 [Capitella teleta]
MSSTIYETDWCCGVVCSLDNACVTPNLAFEKRSSGIHYIQMAFHQCALTCVTPNLAFEKRSSGIHYIQMVFHQCALTCVTPNLSSEKRSSGIHYIQMVFHQCALTCVTPNLAFEKRSSATCMTHSNDDTSLACMAILPYVQLGKVLRIYNSLCL